MYANYYTLFLIPVGIGICLLIKFGSDSGASRRPVVIDCNDYSHVSGCKINRGVFVSEIEKARSRNDRCFMIWGMPVKMGEIELQRLGSRGMKSGPAKEISWMKSYIELNALGDVCGDMLYTDGREGCRNAFSARSAYDILIREGMFRIGKRRDAVHFLKENRITTLKGLDHGKLSGSGVSKPLTIFSLCGTERKSLSVAGLRFSDGNSLLLMLSVGGLIEVVDCC